MGNGYLKLALHIVSANGKNATFNAIVLLFCLGEFEFRSLAGAVRALSEHCFYPKKFTT